jgi:hypothetical protein
MQSASSSNEVTRSTASENPNVLSAATSVEGRNSSPTESSAVTVSRAIQDLQRGYEPCDGTRAHNAALQLFKNLDTVFPWVEIPSDRCCKCGNKHMSSQCGEPSENQTNNILYSARHCSGCAMPLCVA